MSPLRPSPQLPGKYILPTTGWMSIVSVSLDLFNLSQSRGKEQLTPNEAAHNALEIPGQEV
jgi:hypothetical protein